MNIYFDSIKTNKQTEWKNKFLECNYLEGKVEKPEMEIRLLCINLVLQI